MDKSTFPFPKGEVFRIEGSKVAVEMSEMDSSADIFDEDGIPAAKPLPFSENVKYIPFGFDDLLPFHLIHLIGKDEIMSQNKFFNVLTCYGDGLRYNDIETGCPTRDTEIKRWMLDNSLPEFFLEQVVLLPIREGRQSWPHQPHLLCQLAQASGQEDRHRVHHAAG